MESVQMEGLGYKIGDECYSTISHTLDGKSIVPGSRGTVTGPCTTSSLADADQRVEVKFDNGMVANILAKTQITVQMSIEECEARAMFADIDDDNNGVRAAAPGAERSVD